MVAAHFLKYLRCSSLCSNRYPGKTRPLYYNSEVVSRCRVLLRRFAEVSIQPNGKEKDLTRGKKLPPSFDVRCGQSSFGRRVRGSLCDASTTKSWAAFMHTGRNLKLGGCRVPQFIQVLLWQ